MVQLPVVLSLADNQIRFTVLMLIEWKPKKSGLHTIRVMKIPWQEANFLSLIGCYVVIEPFNDHKAYSMNAARLISRPTQTVLAI